MRTRLALVLMLVGSCAPPRPRTEVMLIVESEVGVRAAMDHLRLTVRGSAPGEVDAWSERYDRTFSGAALDQPIELGITPLGDDAARAWEAVAIAATATEEVVVRARTVGPFIRGETRYFRMLLEDSCRGVPCTPDRTCRRGTCVDPKIEPSDLESTPDGGTVTPRDAGTTDASLGALGCAPSSAMEVANGVDGLDIVGRSSGGFWLVMHRTRGIEARALDRRGTVVRMVEGDASSGGMPAVDRLQATAMGDGVAAVWSDGYSVRLFWANPQARTILLSLGDVAQVIPSVAYVPESDLLATAFFESGSWTRRVVGVTASSGAHVFNTPVTPSNPAGRAAQMHASAFDSDVLVAASSTTETQLFRVDAAGVVVANDTLTSLRESSVAAFGSNAALIGQNPERTEMYVWSFNDSAALGENIFHFPLSARRAAMTTPAGDGFAVPLYNGTTLQISIAALPFFPTSEPVPHVVGNASPDLSWLEVATDGEQWLAAWMTTDSVYVQFFCLPR